MGKDPVDAGGPTRAGAFVVHLHDATRRHFDLRVQVGGVLASFAIPKGLTLNPADKHLAVHTEDHPIEYLDFEAVIPKGQYGGGPMILWDRGTIRYLDKSAEEGTASGKLDFILDGFKLHGRYALVRLKSSEKDWLLLKKKDAFASEERDLQAEQPASVLSGLRIDELEHADDRGAALEKRAGALSGAKRRTSAFEVHMPKPEVHAKLPAGSDWFVDVALGGVPIRATRDGEEVVLLLEEEDVTAFYPDVARAIRATPISAWTAAGEIVLFDEHGKPSMARLRERLAWLRAGDTVRATTEGRVVFVMHDLLALGAFDLRACSLQDRRALLSAAIPYPGILRPLEPIDGDPDAVIAFCREHGLWGASAKKKSSHFPPSQGQWQMTEVSPREPFAPHTWGPAVRRAGVMVKNASKVFWPEEGYTKGDLCAYYEQVAPVMVRYVSGRPLVLVRYPDGIAGKSFYQWHPPVGLPSWVGSVVVKDREHTQHKENKRAFLIDDARGLVTLANLGCIPMHILACLADALDTCDFFTIDFDLKGAPLPNAVRLAHRLREWLGEIGLEGFVKTSGQSGMHVLVGLGEGSSFAVARGLADLLGHLLVREFPDISTMERVIEKRGGRIYVDTGQTGPTRTIVCPYSVRAVPHATVSTPLEWREVTPKLDPKVFSMKTVPERIEKKGDPMKSLLGGAVNVAEAVARLEARVRESG